MVAASDKHCRSCGADLKEERRRRTEEIGEEMERAGHLAAEGQYQKAAELLYRIAKLDHPQFVAFARRAASEIERIKADWNRSREQVGALVEEARQRVRDGDRTGAIARLKKIPAGLRTPEVEILLAEEQAKLSEVSTLVAELRSVNGRFSFDSLAKWTRLLDLQPKHPHAVEIARHVGKRAVETALAALAQFQYGKAVKVLERMPPAARTPEIESLRKRAVEIDCLVETMRTARWVDKPLGEIAGRLRQLTPGDKELMVACDELDRRLHVPPQAPRFAVAWAPPPESDGRLLESPAGFERIACAAGLDPAPLVAHPGRFYVACGLALQGIGLATAPINLAPPPPKLQERLVHRLRRWGTKAAWGLDLSASGLKAVKLALDQQKQPVLEVCDLVEHRKPLDQALSAEEANAIVAATIATFLSRRDPKPDRICLGMPGRMFLLRHIRLPKMNPAKLAQAVVFEAKNYFPAPVEQLAWGYWVVKEAMAAEHYGRVGGDDPGAHLEIAIVIARRLSLLNLLRQFETSGLHADIVQCDCLALHNYIVYDRFPPPGASAPGAAPMRPIAAFDLGYDAAQLVVSAPNFVWFRSVPRGSQQINQALVRELKLTFALAEQVKRRPTLAASVADLCATVESAFDKFAWELQTSLDALRSAHGAIEPERILAVGGGMQVHGLLGRLQRAEQRVK